MFLLTSTVIAEEKPFKGTILDVCNMSGWTVTEPIWDKIDEFEKFTGIKVHLNEFPFGELLRKQIMEGALHTGAFDVLEFAGGARIGEIVPYVIPLNEYIDESWGLDTWEKDFAETYRNGCTFDEEIKFIPILGAAQIIFYRKSLFEDPKEKKEFKEKYGYELQPPRTLSELKDIAKFFTRDTNGDGSTDLWGLIFPGSKVQGMLIVYGMFMGNDIGYPDEHWRCQWDSSHPKKRLEAMEIAKFFYDCVNVDKVTSPSIIGKEHSEIIELYLAGKAAMMMSWMHDWWYQITWPEVVDEIGETGSAMIPSQTGGISGSNLHAGGPSWVWAISADSDTKDAAWEFIKWVQSDKIQKYMLSPKEGAKGSFAPARTLTAEWAAKHGYVPPATVESIITRKTNSRDKVMPPIPETSKILHELFGSYVQDLLTGSINPEQFVDRTAEEINQILKDAGY